MSIGIGIDTGGTYTDAVIYDFDNEIVLDSAKALTTKNDLTIGISNVIDKLSIDLLKQQVDSTNKVINLYKSNMDRETISALKIRKEWCKIELIQYTLNLFDEKPSKLRKIWRKIIRKISLKLA